MLANYILDSLYEPPPSPPRVNDDAITIDWDAVISSATQQAFEGANSDRDITLENKPEDIIDVWTALEALTPQLVILQPQNTVYMPKV
jgi:hypothetical protein